MAGRRPWLPMVVCCSTRDELDAVCSAVSNISYISVTPLYSDLAETERALVLDKFRHATMKWNRNAVVESGNEGIEKEEQKSHMIVATDTCLPLLASAESPISSSVLINCELPTKKETYMRRMATCLAADGIVINMVVGGEVVTRNAHKYFRNVLKTFIMKSPKKLLGWLDLLASFSVLFDSILRLASFNT